MSKLQVDDIVNKEDTGAVGFSRGAVITGVATATTFSGALSGNATSATTATNAQGLTGTPNISVGTISASGSVSVGGTLTYEDVTNIDSVGIVTARTGIKVLAGGINAVGISTFSGSASFTGGLVEKYVNAGTTLGSQPNNPLSSGNVILFTGNESSATLTINFTGVHTTLSSGETVSFTAIISPNGSGLITTALVAGQAIAIKWSGGSVPSAGASGQDVYAFQILKTGTGATDYIVFGVASNYA